jgi:hypothetical protein
VATATVTACKAGYTDVVSAPPGPCEEERVGGG